MNITQSPNGFGQAPSGNTGVKLTKYPFAHPHNENFEGEKTKTLDETLKYEGVGCEFGIDWLDASVLIPVSQADAFIKYFASYLDDELTLIGSV